MSKIAFVVGPEFEDTEFRVPFDAVKQAGHEPEMLGKKKGETVEGKQHKEKVEIRHTAGEEDPARYDALVIPGGHSPDQLRMDPGVVSFVKKFIATGKPIAAICHGPQLLVEAADDQVRGKQMTSWPSVRKELELAGARWVDREVVVDGQFITSRNPHDAPAFARALIERL
ncbi:MAG TPA: type 1 glutamine amidotransferase domain-containing protein [Kofleriaceae bacterium]|nr:type 1 glutamine amidotransferase domain-containing protein [Kofleriaceae bacterium]